MSGHLLDAGRRIERPVAYQAASLDGDRLVLRYEALVTDQFGEPVGRAERRGAIALGDLGRDDVAVDALPFERLSDHGVLPGRPLPLHVRGLDADTRDAPPCVDVEPGPDGRPLRFAVHPDGVRFACVYSAALTRTRTALWVYPLLPFTLAIDAVTNPVLLFFAPAVVVLGD